MKTYNKLVRDKIPQIIEQSGKSYIIRTLRLDEYSLGLRQKLLEEVEEYITSYEPEELVDILEVLYCLAELSGLSRLDLENLRQHKLNTKGGFKRRLFLEKIE